MRIWGITTLLAGTAMLGSQVAAPEAHASSYCSQPMAPTTFLVKPMKPYCAWSKSCSQFEVDSYRNDVNRHFEQLKRYSREVNDFYSGASDYIECMAQLD